MDCDDVERNGQSTKKRHKRMDANYGYQLFLMFANSSFAFVLHFENRTLHLKTKFDMSTKVQVTTPAQHDAKPLLAVRCG